MPQPTDTLDYEVFRFRTCCTLSGSARRIHVGKRNKRPAIFLTPTSLEPLPETREFWEDERFYVNLNPLERRTWNLILRGITLRQIAAREGVARSAIYARIGGNSKGQGGMIAKNFWVLRWWQVRQRQRRRRQ